MNTLAKISLALVCIQAASPAAGLRVREHQGSDGKRHIYAWAGGKVAQTGAAQIASGDLDGIVDGLMVWCGVNWNNGGGGTTMEVDLTPHSLWANCTRMKALAKQKGWPFMPVVAVPPAALTAPNTWDGMIASAVAVAKANGLQGYSFDDETSCAPRASLIGFTEWMAFVNAFGAGIKKEGLIFTAAVAYIPCIVDGPKWNESRRDHRACDSSLGKTFLPEVPAMMNNAGSPIWLTMDTYIGPLYNDKWHLANGFYDDFDWYAAHIDGYLLGPGMDHDWGKEDNTRDGDSLLARFHAIDTFNVGYIGYFNLPIPADDLAIIKPFMKRWITRCAGCGVQPVNGCYDMQINCTYKSD